MVRRLKGGHDESAGIVLMVLVSIATVLAAPAGAARVWAGLAMAAAEVGLLLGRHAPPPGALAGLALAVVAGFAALLLASSGLGEVPILVAAARLPRVLPARHRVPVVLAVAVLFGVGIAYVSGNVVGLLAGYGVCLLAQRTVQSAALEGERDRAVGLLAEVEASRDAQAEAAASGERARIAREMHDVLAHSLAGLSLQLQAVRAVAVREGVADAVTIPLQRAADLAREGVAEARAAVGVLSGPAVADRRGIGDVEELVSRFPGTAGFVVTGVARPVPAATGHALYRAVQESLTNAARYAPGARVAVALDWSVTRLVATVSDEGAAHVPSLDPVRGAAPGLGAGAGTAATGTGLAGMAERLQQIGGRLTAGPAGGGWLVRIVVLVEPDIAA